MQIEDRLIERVHSLAPAAVIAISGFGGGGKSSLAALLGARLSAPVVSVDSFIRDRDMTDFARWELMDFDRLRREVLVPLHAGAAAIEYGHLDWGANAITSRRSFAGGQRCLVEGVGLLRPDLREYFAFSVWVHCPLEEAIRRGKRRDRETSGNDAHDDRWDGIWRRNDEECHRLYRPEQTADYLFDNSVPRVQPGP